METLVSFLIAAAVTFLFVRRYLKALAPGKKAPAAAAPTAPCPRCAKPVAGDASFCPSCGAPMALWNVQRAAVHAGTNGSAPAGQPKPVINATLCIGCGSCVSACPETGTLALAGGKAIPAHPDRCLGHAKCVEVCPTQAITLSLGGVLQTVKVPAVNENFESNIPGVFIVGELGGMGLIKTAINEGRLVIDYLRPRLAAEARPSRNGDFDVVIVGAGPAGLSASLTAHQHELKYLTLEQGEIASTIRQYPRQKFLMAEPVEMPLYGSLYIADSTKESLLAVWETIIANTGVRIQTGTRVEAVRRYGGVFRVETQRGEYTARYVVLATGKRGTPRRLGVPGEELPKVAYRLIEADGYQGREILVVGGGDSAVEATLAVARAGKNRVTLSYRGEEFTRARDRNRAKLAAAGAEGRVRVLRSSNVIEILPDAVTLDCAGTRNSIPNDYAFVLIGGESPDGFLRKIGIEIVEKALCG